MNANAKLKQRIDGLDESIKALKIIKKDLEEQLSDLNEATFLACKLWELDKQVEGEELKVRSHGVASEDDINSKVW